MIFAFAAVRGLMQLFAPDKSKTPPSILSNMLPATFPEHLLFTLTRDVQKKQSNTLPPGLPQHPGKWRMLQKGMPILPSGREDQESKDGSKGVGNGMPATGDAQAKAWRKEGTCLGTRALIWFSRDRVRARAEETRLAQGTALDHEEKKRNTI